MMLLKWFLVGLEVCLVHGQLSVTWNGSVVQGPVLIFWDELPLDDPRTVTIGDVNRAGALVCRSENSSQVSWQFTVGTTVHDAPRSDPQLFIQTRTGLGVIPSISRLSRGRENTVSLLSPTLNGEWRCTLPGIAEVNVGIVYRDRVRVSRKGRITDSIVILAPPSANLNSFTLHGRTLGGPVTNYSWTYNGAPIRNGGPFHITTGFHNTDGNYSYQYHRYLSVLTVTGDLPGVYRYTVWNRVTPPIDRRYTVQRVKKPANLRVQQDGPNSIRVFWSAPSPPSVFGYRVTVGHVTSEFESSPGNIIIPSGTYLVEVITIGYPLSSEPLGRVYTVRAFCSRTLEYRLNFNLPTPMQHIEEYLEVVTSTNKEEVSQFLNEYVWPDVTATTVASLPYSQLDLLLIYSLHPMLAPYFCNDLSEVEERFAILFRETINTMTVQFMSDYSSNHLNTVLFIYSYFGQENNLNILGVLDSLCPSTSSDTEHFCRASQAAEIFGKIEKFDISRGETEYNILRANFAFLSLWDPSNSGLTLQIQENIREYTIAVVQTFVYTVDRQNNDALEELDSAFSTYLSVECTESSSLEECLMYSAVTTLSSYVSRSTEITESGRTHKVIYSGTDYEAFFQFNLLTTILRGTENLQSTLQEVATYIQSQIDCENNALGSAIFTNLGNYFGALHTFDEAKAEHDVAYIRGRLRFYNNRSTIYSSLVDGNLSFLLKNAIVLAVQDLGLRTLQIVIEIAENMNPLGWLFGNGSINEILDAIDKAFEAGSRVADLSILFRRLGNKVKPLLDIIKAGLDENARMFAVIVNIVNGLEERSSTFHEDQMTFLREYGAYSPVITRPDLAQLGQELEFLAEDACNIIRDIIGPPVFALIYKIFLYRRCVDTFPLIKDLMETYNEIYDFQFELVETLAAVVRARTGLNAALYLRNSWTSTVTECKSTDVLDRYAMLAGLSEAVYQLETWQAIDEYCTILEYENGGVEPAACDGPNTRLDSLVSFQPDECDYTRDYFSFPAFISSGFDYNTFTPKSIAGKLNLTALLAGESVSFQIPDRNWLVTYDIIKEHEVDIAIYVLTFEIYLPVVSAFKESVTVIAYPSTSNQLVPGGTSYAMDAELVAEYSEGRHVNCIQTLLPNPYSLCESNAPPDICMDSLAFKIPDEQSLVNAPSIYAHWNITVYGYEDLNSIYKPAGDMDVWVGMTLCKKSRGSGKVQSSTKARSMAFARYMQTERCCDDTSQFWSQESLSCEECPSGTAPELYGYYCNDTDECSETEGLCEHTCNNIIGSYYCSCDEGFTLNEDGYSCDDIRECDEPTACDQLCTNSIGSFECSCIDGYTINSDGYQCDYTGIFLTISSVRATSVTVTWVQPPVDSIDVNSYMIVLTRILGSGQALCPDVNDTRSFQTEGNVIAKHFSGLDEFSTYEVSITANSSEFGGALSPPGFAIFTTDTAVPAGAPGGVTASTASRSVNVSWDAIECSERNGIIDYVVEFEKLSGAAVRGEVMNQTFIASGLTPHAEYTFRVAGANRDGRGPFSETITFTTDEDVPGAVSNLMADERDTFLVVMWSPPQETNGVIIAYEIAYWTSFSHTAVNTSTLSTMFLSTDIINISVRAYTSAGPGPESSIITRSGLLPLSPTSVAIAITVVVILIAGAMVVLMLVFSLRQLSDRTNSLYNDDLPMEDYGAEDVGFLVGDEDYTGAADIVEFPSDMCAEEGERVFFRVVMRGDPYPSISWYNNDIELMSDESLDIQQSGSLCILSATQEHSGVYRLLAWNSGGTVEREVKLTVTQQADMNDQKSAEVLPVPADKDSPDN